MSLMKLQRKSTETDTSSLDSLDSQRRHHIVEINDWAISLPTKNGQDFVAVRDWELDVRDGEILSIVGPSGCGKSTLLFAIDAINRVTQGEILVDGERVENPRPELAMVFQEHSLLPWRTVLSNVEFPLEAPGSSPGEGGVDVTSHG